MPQTAADSRELLVQFLAGRDISCPSCGYNLRDQQSDICPECGESIAVGLHMVEPKQAAPLAGLIGLSAGAGLNGLLLIYMGITLIRFHDSPPGIALLITLPAMGVFLVLILAWLWCWPKIRRQPVGIRWTLASLCWVASLVDITIFSLLIR